MTKKKSKKKEKPPNKGRMTGDETSLKNKKWIEYVIRKRNINETKELNK